MSMVQSIFGQVVCALKGGHTISEQDEDRLYENAGGEAQAICIRCGIPVKLRIDAKHPDTYLIEE